MMLWQLIFAFLLSAPAAAFDATMLRTVGAILPHLDAELALVGDQLVFNYQFTFGTLLRSQFSEAPDNRYFRFNTGQRSTPYLLGFRFAPDTSASQVKEKTATPTTMSFTGNLHARMEHKVLGLAADGRSATFYQECWQVELSEGPTAPAQCAMVNKSLCQQINKTGYDWDQSFRKAVEPYRSVMVARLAREFVPADIAENRSMSFKNYEVLAQYQSLDGDIFVDLPPTTKAACQSLCAKLAWVDEDGVDVGTH